MNSTPNLSQQIKCGISATRGQLEEAFIQLVERRKSFYAFISDMILTKQSYVQGEHIKTLCDHAQQVYEGKIDRLIVTLPPRHMKSTIFSEAFPAWILGNNRQAEIIISSYNDGQAAKMMTASRLLMDEPEYLRVFPGMEWTTENVHDAMLKGKDNGRPNLISRGPGSGITGSGADLIILDDLFKSNEDAYSAARRDKIYDWYRGTVLTRLSPGGKIILVGTRWHYDDLIGRVQEEERGQWTVLHMPAIGDDNKALWPERYNIHELERRKLALGSHMFASIYQGKPTPSEGGRFKRSWFTFTDEPLNQDARRVRYYDLATTKDDGDYTAGVLMAIDEDTNEIVIEDIERGQRSAAENEKRIMETANIDGYDVHIRMEEEGGSAGKIAMHSYSKLLEGYAFGSTHPTGAKDVRAMAFAAALEGGRIKLLRGAWNRDYIDELCEFPFGLHDDQVDSSSGAYNYLLGLEKGVVGAGNFAFL